MNGHFTEKKKETNLNTMNARCEFKVRNVSTTEYYSKKHLKETSPEWTADVSGSDNTGRMVVQRYKPSLLGLNPPPTPLVCPNCVNREQWWGKSEWYWRYYVVVLYF